jgi:hypothetical protein
MIKKKWMDISVIIFIVLLFILFLRNFLFSAKVQKKKNTISISETKMKVLQPKSILEKREKQRKPNWLHDPFKEESSSDLIKGLKLKAISVDSNGMPIALINGKFVKEGSHIGLIKVLKIANDYIIVEKGSVRTMIKLRGKR